MSGVTPIVGKKARTDDRRPTEDTKVFQADIAGGVSSLP